MKAHNEYWHQRIQSLITALQSLQDTDTIDQASQSIIWQEIAATASRLASVASAAESWSIQAEVW